MVLRSILAGMAARSRGSFAVPPGESPSDVTRRKMAEWVRERKRKLWMTGALRRKNKDEFFVHAPESSSFLDTITLPMVATAVVLAMFTKLLYMVGLNCTFWAFFQGLLARIVFYLILVIGFGGAAEPRVYSPRKIGT